MQLLSACPKCHIRLKMPPTADGSQPLSCPKCGQALIAPGVVVAGSTGHQGLLLALIGTIVLMGGGIIAALIMTRTPEPAPKVVQSPPAPPPQAVIVKAAPEPDQRRIAEEKKREQEYLHKIDELQAALDKQIKAKDVDDKSAGDLQKLLDQGDEALANKQYAAAVEIFKLALQKSPGEQRASRGLIAAQDALSRDQAERKKQENFTRHLAAAEAAFRADRYADAVTEATAALAIIPDHIRAAGLQREAERRLAANNNQKDQKGQKNQKDDYKRLMDQADLAMRLQRYDEAAATYKKALEAAPNDTAATKGLADAGLALQNAARTAYLAAMQRGNLALSSLSYNEAVVAFTEALRLVVNDAQATAALQNAQAALANYLALLADANVFVQAGNVAAQQRKYAAAAHDYREALRILPNHPQATAIFVLLRYNDNMADGGRAMDAHRYADAVRHYRAALVDAPNDPSATTALNQATAQNAKKK